MAWVALEHLWASNRDTYRCSGYCMVFGIFTEEHESVEMVEDEKSIGGDEDSQGERFRQDVWTDQGPFQMWETSGRRLHIAACYYNRHVLNNFVHVLLPFKFEYCNTTQQYTSTPYRLPVYTYVYKSVCDWMHCVYSIAIHSLYLSQNVLKPSICRCFRNTCPGRPAAASTFRVPLETGWGRLARLGAPAIIIMPTPKVGRFPCTGPRVFQTGNNHLAGQT